MENSNYKAHQNGVSDDQSSADFLLKPSRRTVKLEENTSFKKSPIRRFLTQGVPNMVKSVKRRCSKSGTPAYEQGCSIEEFLATNKVLPRRTSAASSTAGPGSSQPLPNHGVRTRGPLQVQNVADQDSGLYSAGQQAYVAASEIDPIDQSLFADFDCDCTQGRNR